jgi:HK97 family phage major capsid protein
MKTPAEIKAAIAELKAKKAGITAEMDQIYERSGPDGVSGGLAERWDNLATGAKKLDTEIIYAERALVELVYNASSRTYSGDGAHYEDFNVNTRTGDPFDIGSISASSRAEFDAEVTSRAVDVIERSNLFVEGDHQERATELVNTHQNDDSFAEHIIARSHPDYAKAWARMMAGESHLLSDAERAAVSLVERQNRSMALTNVTSKLVPAFLDPTVIISNDGSQNPFRRIARVVPVTTNVWTGVSSVGITGGWTGAEGSEVDDDSPSFANPAVTCHMADAFIPISFQAYEDWFGGAEEIVRLFADYRDQLEEVAFATGSGSNQPYGVVTAMAATTAYIVAMATNNSFVVADLFTAKQALPARWKANATWLSEETYLDRVRQFATNGSYAYSFTADLTSGDLAKVLGKPWELSSSMTGTLSTTTNNAIVYGDFKSGYLIADRTASFSVELVQNLFHTSNNRPSGQRGWLCHWRVGADAIVPRAMRLLVNPNTAYV